IAPPSEFTRDSEALHDATAVRAHFQRAVGEARLHCVDAHALAEQHHGDTILANMIMLGHAWQLGAIPVGLAAIERAIELNGVAVEANLQAFQLGRLAAWQPEALQAATPVKPQYEPAKATFEEVVARNSRALTAYQNAAYARRYGNALEKLR